MTKLELKILEKAVLERYKEIKEDRFGFHFNCYLTVESFVNELRLADFGKMTYEDGTARGRIKDILYKVVLDKTDNTCTVHYNFSYEEYMKRFLVL